MANSTKKRGQTVTVFLLLGIVLIAMVGFVLFLRGGMEDTGVEDAADLGLSTTSFKAHAHQCLKQEVLNAVDKYGVSDGQGPYIGAYVRRNLPKCIEWDFYEEQGFAITAGNPEVQVEIAPDTLLVDVKYPLEGEDERGAFSFEELYYYLPRGISGQLRFDGADKTKAEVSVSSSDGDAELIIPEGTVVKDAEGNPVEKVKLRVLERDFNGLANPLVVGMVAYEITPHVTFSNPVTLKMTYREQDIPSGVEESALRLAQFERKFNMWFSVPTTVNTAKNTLTAQFTHFSAVAPVARCSDGEADRIEFPVSMLSTDSGGNFVFLQDCGDDTECAEVTWKPRDEPALFEYPEGFSGDPLGGLGEIKLIPVKDLENEGQFLTPEKAYNQVVLSLCTVNDWDLDDVVDSITEDKIEKTVEECNGFSLQEDCVSEGEKEDTVDACKLAITSFVESNEPYADLLAAYQAEEGTGDAIRDHERTPETAEVGEEIMSWCTCTITAENADTAGSVGELTFSTDCEPVVATPPTYGYSPVEGGSISDPWDLPGGFGVLRFRFAGTGGGCVALDGGGKPHIELAVESPSDGENAVSWKVNPYTGSSEDPNFLKLTPADSGTAKVAEAWTNWDSYKGDPEAGDYELYSGGTFYNEIYIRVDNLDDDGCVNAIVTDFAIYGVGIVYDVPAGAYEHCTVTVQDRVNYLCGCDGNCNTRQGLVEGEDDWGADSQLNILASWRGEWNPTAGSVVNGQTRLCDLDPNDLRLQELKSKGWTPYGGYCVNGQPVNMTPVVVGGQCESTGVSACDYSAEPHKTMECRESSDNKTWEAAAECGEGQVCRIMGDGATCVGERDMSCTVSSPGQTVYTPIDDTCYVCDTSSDNPLEGELKVTSPARDPYATPPCNDPEIRLCDSDMLQCAPQDSTSCEGLVGNWSVYEDGDATGECENDPSVGDVCCQRTVEGVGVCPSGGYSQTTAIGATLRRLLNECRGWGVGYSCVGDAESTQTSIYCGQDTAENWFRCYKICTGTTCGADGCTERAPACRDITSCTDYNTATPTDFPPVTDKSSLCMADPCTISGGCTLVGGSCVPIGTECSPDIPRPGLPPGTPAQKYWMETRRECYECARLRGDYQWRETTVDKCTCAGGVTIGQTAWSAAEGCRRCDGVDQWTPVNVNHYNCPDKLCVTRPSGYIVVPEQAVCLGDTGERVYQYAECHVDTQGEPQITSRVCGMGCTAGEKKTPDQFATECACPERGRCNTCFPVGLIWMYGREGEYKLTGSGNCYVCHGRAGRNWDLSSGCTCRDVDIEGEFDIAIGQFNWDEVEKECRRCIADTSDPQTTPAHWTTSGVTTSQCGTSAKCLTHPSVSVPVGGIWFNEWLCIAGAPNSRVQKCLGNGEWGEETLCDWGCQEGQTTPLASCDPANH